MQDQREQARYYREHAGPTVALRLVRSLKKAVAELQRNPAIGSPRLGLQIGLDRLRTWAVRGFPLLYLYIEREDYLDVVRLLGQRQDVAGIMAELD